MKAVECDSGACLELTAAGRPLRMIITPRGPVEPLFWSRLREELPSTQSRSDAAELHVPAQVFMSRRPAVHILCKQFSVGLRVDQPAQELLLRALEEEQTLHQVVSRPTEGNDRTASEALAASRFSKRALLPFQERDLEKLFALPHGANFSVPGAGKTSVAYASFELERLAGRVERLLVVAPISAFESWYTEAEACFSPQPVVGTFDPARRPPSTVEVLLVNYEKLLKHLESVIGWIAEHPCHVILDEAHRIKKGRAGAWGSACLDLAWHATRRDVLTGTPAPQHPSDLEALLDFCWPSQARRILPSAAFDRRPASGVAKSVADAVRPLFVRTRKSELGLAEPSMRVLTLELHGLHREIYLAITNQYSGQIRLLRRDQHRFAQMGRVVMYLLEAATNPSLLTVGASRHDPKVFRHPPAVVSPDSHLAELLLDYSQYETPAKFRKLGELIRDNADHGRKTLVWSNFVANLGLLRKLLATYEPAVIHGGVPTTAASSMMTAPTRAEEIHRFRTDERCLVLLANPAALAEGVSLHHECHEAVYLERTFNAGQYLQSVDRIHRLGLADDVTTRITFLQTKETIDEVVHSRVDEKARRLGGMLDDPDIVTMALPDESDFEDVTTGLGQPIDDQEDVAALFAHLRGNDAS